MLKTKIQSMSHHTCPNSDSCNLKNITNIYIFLSPSQVHTYVSDTNTQDIGMIGFVSENKRQPKIARHSRNESQIMHCSNLSQ